MRLLIATLVLAAYSGPVTVYPDAYCSGLVTGETVKDKVADALEDCAPMIRMTVKL